MEIWQNLEKNATQIMIFRPHLCGRKITTQIMIFLPHLCGRKITNTESHLRWTTKKFKADSQMEKFKNSRVGGKGQNRI